ncbi:MAG: hypothetical protein JWN57_1179 [Frankiales bacterium]|jgi:hypothetical protein|nr:hypothetical protein [Frankiales bacterium]
MDPERDQEPVRPDSWGEPPPASSSGSVPAGRLDPALDPDRYRPGLDLPWDNEQEDPAGARGGRTLPRLLGAGAHEDERDNAAWAVGLIGMLLFLGLVAFLFSSVINP